MSKQVYEHWCGNCQIQIYMRRHYGWELTWQNCPYTCEYATAIRCSTEAKENRMDDSINRQAAIDAADRADYTGLAVEDAKQVTDEDIEELRRLPFVKSERKHGKWMRITDEPFADHFECSECGKLPPLKDFEWWLSDYCPNCGADMRGESNDSM